MTRQARSERTARLLSQRLEELVSLERAGAPPRSIARLREQAAGATAHAVELGLLTPARAEAIWRTSAQAPAAHDAGRGI